MRFKKTLLITILIIPAIGYCGLIGWITGYPEVKEKIEKRLEEKYPGDKFKVWDVSYSNNLGGYNFKAKDLSYKDLESGGSYYEKENSVVDNFQQIITNKQWQNLVQPIVDKYSKNNIILGSLRARNPLGDFIKNASPADNVLDNLYKNNLTAKEWINSDHLYLSGDISIFMNIPKTPQGMLKTLKLIEKLNNYYHSLNLYSYEIAVILMEVPQDFDIYNYISNKNMVNDYHEYMHFLKKNNMPQYVWGWLKIYACSKINQFEKSCLYTQPSRSIFLDKKPMQPRKWIGVQMEFSPLINTQLYKQALQLENK